ncbi:hypothetical protein NDU88_003432 [Pleurodeles waltl]|uniref:Uncharacterized protein n=1 Tax=Pleurodeles waltl TaxID=8319 RepID=A0AAV7VH31_PLEWA|nr:hypothetical protein NDU88_003432 [Pleurodeles waltl]
MVDKGTSSFNSNIGGTLVPPKQAKARGAQRHLGAIQQTKVTRGIQDGGRIFRLIATTALAHPLSARGSRSPATKAADAADAACLQHGLLQALHGSLVASPRIEATRASTGGRRKKN